MKSITQNGALSAWRRARDAGALNVLAVLKVFWVSARDGHVVGYTYILCLTFSFHTFAITVLRLDYITLVQSRFSPPQIGLSSYVTFQSTFWTALLIILATLLTSFVTLHLQFSEYPARFSVHLRPTLRSSKSASGNFTLVNPATMSASSEAHPFLVALARAGLN
ncbi:hypothetical protein CROQUDRAFT_90294 [Cronartium quercuum f. sp. fusiforme G11]|uniref:Uncharacterized protein n=1 Tax=Cronartium quercuum f. sp. fusiforme G11 TaxID=708437 RepID=A0A9P6NQD0_9BASI|nr:hypothetical protein CROQUDRAFT_90294 [Cronartium quercuum f. sp. fusiforme G11]